MKLLAHFGGFDMTYHELFYYNNNKVGPKFDGKKISAKCVKKARKTLKAYHAELHDFNSKILSIKRDSSDLYNQMMANLKKYQKVSKSACSREDYSNYDSINKMQTDLEELKRLFQEKIMQTDLEESKRLLKEKSPETSTKHRSL